MTRPKHRRTQPLAEREVDPGTSPAASPEPVSIARVPVHETMVRVRNVSGQTIDCAYLDEAGTRQTMRLGPHGVSPSLAASRIDAFTSTMVERGHLKIEPAR